MEFRNKKKGEEGILEMELILVVELVSTEIKFT